MTDRLGLLPVMLTYVLDLLRLWFCFSLPPFLIVCFFQLCLFHKMFLWLP